MSAAPRTKRVRNLVVGDRVVEKGFRPYRVNRLRVDGAMLEADVSWLDGEGGSGKRMWPIDLLEREVETR